LTSNLASGIVAFWLGPSLEGPEAALARRDWWYRGGEAVDVEIRARFGELLPRACAGALSEWERTATGALALVIVLDQFTRNLYRHTPDAYIGDSSAFKIVENTIDLKLDRELHPVARIWLYHPFHHAEDIQQQDRGLTLLHDLEQTSEEVWQPIVRRAIEGWTRHRNIVARFGRFPHRNQVLGRIDTADEREFLSKDGDSFGQGRK
jgi:uncharacterized protein (DUF924 family)